MKKLRSGLDLKKAIINTLRKEGETSLRKLDIKLNTSSQTVHTHCDELAYFGIIEFISHNKNPKNGRPYTTVRLTEYGKKLKFNIP